MGVILGILAICILSLVHIIDNFIMLFTGVKGRKWYQLIDEKAFDKAFNIDVFGNYQYRELWNVILIKSDGYKFGVWGETMSSAFGKNIQLKELNWFGWSIACLIDLVDFSKWKSGFKGKGFHCVRAIQTDEEILNFIKK